MHIPLSKMKGQGRGLFGNRKAEYRLRLKECGGNALIGRPRLAAKKTMPAAEKRTLVAGKRNRVNETEKTVPMNPDTDIFLAERGGGGSPPYWRGQ